MRVPSLHKIELIPTLLWLEAFGLAGLAIALKAHWLLPFAGILVLVAGILSRWPWVGVLLGGGLVGTGSWCFIADKTNFLPPQASWAVSALVLGAILAFLEVLQGTSPAQKRPLTRCLLRLVVLLHFIVAGALFAALYLGSSWQAWLSAAAGLVGTVLVLDTLARLIWRLYTPPRHWAGLREPGAFFFYRWLGDDWREALPQKLSVEAAEENFGPRLEDMSMWPTVSRALPGLAALILLLVWLGSAVHEVPAGLRGARQTLGAWRGTDLAPGLHFSLPWPLGTVTPVDTGRVRELVLGFRADPGKPIFWERAHYEGEEQSLVGGGDDLLSISVPILYRVTDPVRFLRSAAAPEALVAQEGQRVMLALSLRRSAAEIMTTAREEMRQDFQRELQLSLDRADIGITIAEIYLRDIHPPVAVAGTFQEVVAAMEDKEAMILEAESYRRDVLSNSSGSAKAIQTNAKAVAHNRQVQVEGQTSRFASLHQGWAIDPRLYQWREGFRVFDEALGGTKKVIVDEAVSGKLPAHVDLRRVLNPDLVNTAPPAPQTLVPRPEKSREAFDLDIEGYLKAGAGDIPSVQMGADDADNLLQPPSNPPKP